MNILLFSSAAILTVAFVMSILFFAKKKIEGRHLDKNHLTYYLFTAIKNPFQIFILLNLIYGILFLAVQFYPEQLNNDKFLVANHLIDCINIFLLFWSILNLIKYGKVYLSNLMIQSGHPTINAILPAIVHTLYAILALFMLDLFIAELGFSNLPVAILEKFTKIFFIAALGWIFMQMVNIFEQYILTRYLLPDNLNAVTSRKLRTQVSILKRVILSLGIIVTISAILMVFDSVKNFGAGILTTAGIISAVGAFASQQSLMRIFAGLQLAFTQPIKIGDTVIIDNEFGQVEEINLSYVVIKLWDLRRLIKPTDYFTSNGVQNLTRESSQLLGTIYIYADYTLPVNAVRDQYFKLLEESTSWDKKVKALEVTEVTEKSMQIRALMSAENASVLWNLRCEIREKLIKYLVETYPECLSKTRSIAINLTPADQANNQDMKEMEYQ